MNPSIQKVRTKILSYEILAFLPSTYNYPNNERKNGYQRLNASSVVSCSAKAKLCRAKRAHGRYTVVGGCDIVNDCEIQ